MAWTDYNASLVGMVAGEFKQINTNNPSDVSLARTRANFDAGSVWANDAAVAAEIRAISDTALSAFSSGSINHDNGDIVTKGYGHTDGGDGSIFLFSPSTLAYTLLAKSPMYNTTLPTVTCSITEIVAGTPPRITVDADVIVTGDQVVITSTTDADGTYQAVRVDSTHVDLYNVDGTYSAKYTAFAGGSLTDSTGTATVTWNNQGTETSTYYAQTNADGDQMPPCGHTYHFTYCGNNTFLLTQGFLFEDGNGTQGRLWFCDTSRSPPCYRGYHHPGATSTEPETNWGGSWGAAGPITYNPWDGLVYGMDPTTKNFNYRTYQWAADFQQVTSIEFDGSLNADFQGAAVVMPHPEDANKRLLFCHQTTAGSDDFAICKDIETGGTRLMEGRTLVSGDSLLTGMVGKDFIGMCYNDVDGNIYYWGGGSKIGRIIPDTDYAAWDFEDYIPGTPSGDVPTSTGASHACSMYKIPDQPAFLLVQGTNVYLYTYDTPTSSSGNPNYYYHQQSVVL